MQKNVSVQNDVSIDERICGGQLVADKNMDDQSIDSAINVEVKEIFVYQPLVVFFSWTEPWEH